MSILVSTDQQLHDLCVQTLAVHGNLARGGFAGDRIAGLFEAIRVAQHVAYAVSYSEELHVPVMQFPTSATPEAMLNLPALKDLYDALINVGANTFDRSGNGWLPEGWARLLNAVRTRTAAKAARF